MMCSTRELGIRGLKTKRLVPRLPSSLSLSHLPCSLWIYLELSDSSKQAMYFSTPYLAALLPALATLASASCAHLTRRGPSALFSYTPPTGPEQWHALSPSNALCATGSFQSPIDLSAPYNVRNYVSVSNFSTFDIGGQEIELENLGTTVMGFLNGTVRYEGVGYGLVQFHVHTPSEHYMPPDSSEEMKRESMGWEGEVHFVFESADSDLAVVGLLLEADAARDGEAQDNGVVGRVLKAFSDIPEKGDAMILEGVEFGDIVGHIKDNPLYAYTGSLTTPPCSEGVQWLVSSIPLKVSKKAVEDAQSVMGENNRPLQGVLGRGGNDSGLDDGSGAPEVTASATGRVRVTRTVYACGAVATD